eukprot:364316-Chlamydomonas_euryale.AAC.7
MRRWVAISMLGYMLARSLLPQVVCRVQPPALKRLQVAAQQPSAVPRPWRDTHAVRHAVAQHVHTQLHTLAACEQLRNARQHTAAA